jgi:hypothetical protein
MTVPTSLDVGVRTRLQHVADLDPERRHDVGLLAVAVMQERDARRAVGIVLDGSDLGRHAVFGPLEVDPPVHDLMPATAMAHGDVPIEVAAGDPLLRLEQRLFRTLLRDLLE